jgi:hydroxypyruvate isomerase
MKRRKFLEQSILTAGASVFTATNVLAGENNKNFEGMPANDKPFNQNYGFHQGMFKNHAGDNFIDQIKFAYERGFRSIEDNGMMGRTPKCNRK